MERDRLLVPVANPETADYLLETALDLANEFDYVIDILHVIRVPDQIPLSEGARIFEDEEGIVDSGLQKVKDAGIEGNGRIRYARSVPRGVIGAAAEDDVATLLLGWRGRPRRQDIILGSYLDVIINRVDCDVLIERVGQRSPEIQSILLPVARGPHTAYAAMIAGGLARQHDASIEMIHVITEDTDTAKKRAERSFSDAAENIGAIPGMEQHVLTEPDIVESIVDRSHEHDLTVLGAAREGLVYQILFGEVAESVGRMAGSGVILAKRDLGVVARFPFLRRWF